MIHGSTNVLGCGYEKEMKFSGMEKSKSSYNFMKVLWRDLKHKKILAHFANTGIWNARMGDLSAD